MEMEIMVIVKSKEVKMEKLGTENIQKVGDALSLVIVAGKKIGEDKKISPEDLVHVVSLASNAGKLAEGFGAFGKAIEEGKDIDVSEVLELIKYVDAKVKEIEKA
jgi:hypothetical protein